MSIRAKILELERSGKIVRYRASLKRNEQTKRDLFMEPDAHEICPAKGPSRVSRVNGKSLAAARAQVTDFVAGKPVEYDHDFKWLDDQDDDVWELRTHQNPQLRLFGWFPCPDWFVVTNCELREELRSEKKWNQAISKAIKVREALVPGYEPFRGRSWANYITLKSIENF